MLAFEASLGLPFAGAFVHESPLSWIARNDSKPERESAGEAWVLHASPEWSDRYIDAEADTVLPKLISAFWQATGAQRRATSYAAGHKWRYSIPPEPLDSPCLFDSQLKIGACGDWCGGPRVEGAFVSGMTLAEHVLASFDRIHSAVTIPVTRSVQTQAMLGPDEDFCRCRSRLGAGWSWIHVDSADK